MSKHTIEGFITYRAPRFADMEAEISFHTYNPESFSQSKFVVVAPHSIEVEVPDNFDPRPKMVAALEKQKQEARAEFAKRVTEIDAQIQSLLALEAS